jgi:3-oxoacyl-[acyl-carrier-protein] synthase I
MGVRIAAVGMVSSLGLDWATSCAAARAGIMRAQGLQHYNLQVTAPCDVHPAVGYQVDLLTRGFEQRGRLLRLLTGALRDLWRDVLGRYGNLLSRACEVPVYLALPDENRIGANSALMLEEGWEEARAWDEEDSDDEEAFHEPPLFEDAVRLSKWPRPVRLAAEDKAGPVSLLQLVERCHRDMRNGNAQWAIVGAVDSLLDDGTLTWLQKTGRLKTGVVPTGLMPGEAAVLFLVEIMNAGATSLGEFESTIVGVESSSLASGQQSSGAVLAHVIERAGTPVGWPSSSAPWIISDHNGEAYSANEWGCAVQRLTSRNNAFGHAQILFPAMVFGDTGCARLAVAMACALAAWERGYAQDSRCCIAGTSDEGVRGAAVLRSLSTGRV